MHPMFCDWLLNYLTERSQSVWITNKTLTIIITKTAYPLGCVLSPILHTLFTHDCVSSYKDNNITKLAYDAALI